MRPQEPLMGAALNYRMTLESRLPPEDVRQFGPVPKLFLVVPTHTFWRHGKEEPRILLTCGLIDQHVGPRRVRHDYGWRWGAEDAKRFLGQIWHAEWFLTRSYLALQRMLVCLTLAGGFPAMLQRAESTPAEVLESEALYFDKQLFISTYSLARGILAVAEQDDWPTMHVNA